MRSGYLVRVAPPDAVLDECLGCWGLVFRQRVLSCAWRRGDEDFPRDTESSRRRLHRHLAHLVRRLGGNARGLGNHPPPLILRRSASARGSGRGVLAALASAKASRVADSANPSFSAAATKCR